MKILFLQYKKLINLKCIKIKKVLKKNKKIHKQIYKQIHKKNGDEKIAMLKSIGIDFNRDIDEDFRYGAWFRRVAFQKELDAETLAKIPDKQRAIDENGKMFVTRSEVRQLKFGMPLSKMANRLAVVLGDEKPREKATDRAFEDL